MKITKFHRAASVIKFSVENPTDQGEETVSKECPEAPFKECDDALQGLIDVIISVMELPLHWAGKPDARTVLVTGFDISYTKAGTRSIKVYFTKAYRCGKTEKLKTPLVQIDDPQEGETEESALAIGERVVCNAALEQATLYIGGHRQDMNVKGIQLGRPEDPNQETLGLEEKESE